MEQQKEIINELKRNFDRILKANESVLNNIPEEDRVKIAPIHADITAILNCVKTGDLMKINEIRQKYADSSNI